MGISTKKNHVACDECTVNCSKVHKRWRRETAMSTSSGRFSFFKIMLGTFKTTLFIPPKFHGKILTLVNQTTTIEDSEGKSWGVQISLFENCLVFQQGWERFVEAHDIVMGEMLVFQYVAEKSSFIVHIFAKTCCERLHFPSKTNSSEGNCTSKRKRGDDHDHRRLKSSILNEDPTKIKNPDIQRNQVDDDGGIKSSIPSEDLTTTIKIDIKRKRDDDRGGLKSSVTNEHPSKMQKPNVHASDEAKASKQINYNHLLESMMRPLKKCSTTMVATRREVENPISLQDEQDCTIVVAEDGTCFIVRENEFVEKDSIMVTPIHFDQPETSIQLESNGPDGSSCGDSFAMDGNNATPGTEPESDIINSFTKFHEKPESRGGNPSNDTLLVDATKNAKKDECDIDLQCGDKKSTNITMVEKSQAEEEENPRNDTMFVDASKNGNNRNIDAHGVDAMVKKPEIEGGGNPSNDTLSVIATKHGNNDDIHIDAQSDDLKSCNIIMVKKTDAEGGGNPRNGSMFVDSTIKEKYDDIDIHVQCDDTKNINTTMVENPQVEEENPSIDTMFGDASKNAKKDECDIDVQCGGKKNTNITMAEKSQVEEEENPSNDTMFVDASKNGNNDDIHIDAQCDDVKSCNITMVEKTDVEGGGNPRNGSMFVDSTIKEKEENMNGKSWAMVTTTEKTDSNLFLLLPAASAASNDLLVKFSFHVTGNPHKPWLELSEEPLPLPKKKERKVVLFRDSNNNVWPILYVESKNFVGFLGGWQAFASAQDIQEGDLCSLEMASESHSLFDARISRM